MTGDVPGPSRTGSRAGARRLEQPLGPAMDRRSTSGGNVDPIAAAKTACTGMADLMNANAKVPRLEPVDV